MAARGRAAGGVVMRRLPALTAVLAALVLGLSPVPAAADSLGMVGAGLRLDACPAAASVCHYRLPANIQAARDGCYQAAADQLAVPLGAGYVGWWQTADRSTRADWTRAVDACQDQHQPSGGRWAWNQLVLVGTVP